MKILTKEEIQSKDIFTYHLVDGSHIIAEEVDYDMDNDIVHIIAPVAMVDEDTGFSLREWSVIEPGQVVHLRDSKVVAQSLAPYDLKKVYLEFNLLAHLHEVMKRSKASETSTPEVDSNDLFDKLGLTPKKRKKNGPYTGWDGYPRPWPPEEDI
tara:strand:+ start:3205 stop:3666 length:462 start_codon:yes stop_codon:yes gene_type:complete